MKVLIVGLSDTIFGDLVRAILIHHGFYVDIEVHSEDEETGSTWCFVLKELKK